MRWKFELFDAGQVEPYHATYVYSDDWLPLQVEGALEVGRAHRIELTRVPPTVASEHPAGS